MSLAPLSAPGSLLPEEIITLLCGTWFVGFVTAKFSSDLDRIARCARQLLRDLDVSSISFVWIPPLLEVVGQERWCWH